MNQTRGAIAALVSLVGAGAVGLLLAWVPIFEGRPERGYIDPVGIVTACSGHTETAELRPYTTEECEALLAGDLIKHAEGAAKCIDFEPLTPPQRAAVVSFTFNVGVRRFCESTFRDKLEARDLSACAELSKWVYAGGRVLPGLVKRRAIERKWCEVWPKGHTSTIGIRGFEEIHAP